MFRKAYFDFLKNKTAENGPFLGLAPASALFPDQAVVFTGQAIMRAAYRDNNRNL